MREFWRGPFLKRVLSALLCVSMVVSMMQVANTKEDALENDAAEVQTESEEYNEEVKPSELVETELMAEEPETEFNAWLGEVLEKTPAEKPSGTLVDEEADEPFHILQDAEVLKPSDTQTAPDENLPSGTPEAGGETVTQYYEVRFERGADKNEWDVRLPETRLYPSGTKIAELPTPYQSNGIFLGWYYDEGLTSRVESSDEVTKNMTLYARMSDSLADVPAEEVAYYCTRTDVGSDFAFQVKADSAEQVKAELSVIQISANNKVVSEEENGIRIEDAGNGIFTIAADWEEGHTYQAKLDEEGTSLFVVDSIEQPDSVDILNFLTKKEEVLNLRLREDLKYISFSEVTNMSDSLAGLFQVSVGNAAGGITGVEDSGTFEYSGGGIEAGDKAAIYMGTLPAVRTTETDNGTVVYAEIVSVDGTTYTYTTADAKDVLFIPDVFPVSNIADLDGDTENSSITAAKSTFDFSDDKYAMMGLDSQSVVEKGDFFAFYEGAFGAQEASVLSYAEITDVKDNGAEYTITYKTVDEKTVMASMDIYNSRTEKIDLSEAEIAELEADIERQAKESGFVENAVDYLAEMALETEGFTELSKTMNLKSVSISKREVPLVTANSGGKSGGKAEITKKEIEARISVGDSVLEHFEESGGMRAELTLSFEMEIKSSEDSENKIVISVEAVFEQEVLLDVNVSGGAVWKWAWIIPYIYDYQLNANFDIGTYTGIAVTADMTTAEEDEDDDNEEDGDEEENEDAGLLSFDWDSVMGENLSFNDRVVNIGVQIEKLIAAEEEFFGESAKDEEGEEEEDGGFIELYSEMMETAEDSWIELVRKEIFNLEGSVDPFHILVYGISADFVVSANMHITLGMTFEYGNAKRYNFSLMLFHGKVTTETIDLETAHYEFVFYVMGTLGIRAGVEFEVAVGLISLKLDSIGITAEAGAYAQLWGFFYYSLSWEEGSDTVSVCCGAMHFEIGIYLEIKFKAQLFSSEKLTYQPTLYENQWPIYTAGEQNYVYDFDYSEEETPEISFQSIKTLSLPTSLFDMQYMDMQSGEVYGGEDADEEHPAGNYDDEEESHFIILFSNPAFSYDGNGNILTVTPSSDSSVEETCEMSIIWQEAPLAFVSDPIIRTVEITWTDPQNTRYIAFDSKGGSLVEMISTKAGTEIGLPEAPEKQGYDFGGWYLEAECIVKYDFPQTMPEFSVEERGITLYAKWNPALNTYKTEYYLQELNGTYKLAGTKWQKGYTDSFTEVDVTAPKGFKLNEKKTDAKKVISADGATIAKVYFNREKYNLTFSYGEDFITEDVSDIVYKNVQYGAAVFAPIMNLGGYIFDGWDVEPAETMPIGDMIYTAKWKPQPDTPYRIEYYIQDTDQEGYELSSIEIRNGETGSSVLIEDLKISRPEGLSYKKATVDGAEVVSTEIDASGERIIKLYYDRKEYRMVFDAQNGTEPTEQSVLYGARIPAPPEPQRKGYYFGGWYTNEACTGTQFDFAFERMQGADLVLYAKWTANDYIVQFDANGGTGTMNAQTFVYDRVQELSSNTFQRKGYTHAGWNTASDGSGSSYADSQEVMNLSTEAPVTLYAQWKGITYQTAFDGNGADSGSMEHQVHVYGTKQTLTRNEFEKIGYVFAGWSDTKDGSVVYADSAEVLNLTSEQDAVLTLYATWKPATDTGYYVEHYVQQLDGTYLLYDSERKTGTTGTQAEVSGRRMEGFHFDTENEANVTTGTILADGSLTLKLHYVRDSYQVTWKGYLGEVHEQTVVVYGDSITLPQTNPVREGYGFAGWKDVADVMPATDVVYEAEWTPNTYQIVFHANHGTEEIKEQQMIYDIAINLDCNTFENAGYVFYGWAQQPDGEMVYTDSASVQNLTAEPNAQIHLYAKWEAGTGTKYTVVHYLQKVDNDEYEPDIERTQELVGVTEAYTAAGAHNYTGFTPLVFEQQVIAGDGTTVVEVYYNRNTHKVTFRPENGSDNIVIENVRYGAPIVISENPMKEGYTFTGWSPETTVTMPDCDVVYTALWRINSYPVTFDSAGGSAVDGQSVQYGANAAEPAEPFRVGYTFDGWYYGDSPYDFAAAVKGELSLTAHWKANSYIVALDVNEGDVLESSQLAIVYGSPYENLPIPIKTGYSFEGWHTAKTGGVLVTSETLMTTAEAHTLYAHWRINTYRVVFDGNGGEGQMPVQRFTYGVAQNLSTNVLSKEGHCFIGWNTAVDGMGTAYMDGANVMNLTSESEGTVILYAQWSKNSYIITFKKDVNDTGIEKSFEYGSVPEEEQLTRSGYEQTGWDQPFPEVMPAEDLVLIAEWEPIIYPIHYEGVENTDMEGGRSSYTIETEQFTLSIPKKTGYTFNGWTGTGLSEATQLVAVEKGSFGERTYTANWTANQYTVYFWPNGGNGSMENQVFSYDETGELTPNSFVSEHYNFVGWNTKTDGTGESYADGQEVSNLATGGAINLYAQWKLKNYTVTFKDYNGTVLMEQSVVAFGEAEAPQVTLTRTGYTFAGWDGEFDYITGDTTVTAVYQANTYQFIVATDYDYQVGTESIGTASIGGNTTGTFTYDDTYTITANPGSTYDYAGFTVNGKTYDSSIKSFKADFAEDIEVTVHFARKTYQAKASCYKLVFEQRVGTDSSCTIDVTVTWSDGTKTTKTANMDVSENALTFKEKYGVYPTNVSCKGSGGLSRTFYYNVYVTDLMMVNKHNVASGNKYWVLAPEYSWNVSGLGAVTGTSIPVITIASDKKASINLTTYGLYGNTLGSPEYFCYNDAVSIEGSVITIDGSKVSKDGTSIEVRANGSVVTSFVCKQQ